MSFWAAIVLIVAIVSIAQVMRAKQNASAGYATDEDGNPVRLDRGDEDRLRAEIAELKERIHVLERIATDDRQSVGLAEEIEKLRDRREV
ncbi:hypothetical protein [Croceicoccus sp. YJ47]|uniref:hypothetical protein n=1 Tax=Croceicoccus sp. YJ47 TaxID=2798724 RepID=UPI0019231DA1|nr:hypothetical protein [Croceicoccus sp. YJ47]QQN73274.1 hypothetical protein JD971_10485 [Croceicoccus sp. YJ47]